MVPFLYSGEYCDWVLDEYTSGHSELCYSQIREGCVVKMAHEENHPRIGRKILKSVNKDYLIRKNGTEYK
jgi:hypothetical protein